MVPDIHPLVLESILNLLAQEGIVVWLDEPCNTCGGGNAACGGDDKVTLLRKILMKLKALPFGSGPSEPYRPGDNATDVERKILQSICLV